MKNNTYIELSVDGTMMNAYLAIPTSMTSQFPAIILLQEAFGVNSHIRKVASDFADKGYIVIAPELFHRTAPKYWEGDYTDFQGTMPHYSSLTTEGLSADLKTCYEWLIAANNVDKDSIFSIGYCVGGKVSILANATLPIKAGISYYAARADEMIEKMSNLSGPHLFFWGGLDKHIPNETVNKVIDALEIAGKNYINVKISNADHGFNCDQRLAYNEIASNNALALTLAFMKNN